MNDLSRRGFVAGTGGAIAALVLHGCGDDEPSVPDGNTGVPAGVTEVTLDVAFVQSQLAGRAVKLRAYGGVLPGPTITTHPGDLLRIRVRNRLPEYDSSAWEEDVKVLGHVVGMNVPHELNTTNIHVHGMEVIPHLFEPIGTSNPEAPMIAIGPGQEKTYDFALPPDHPSGLYWYHPHRHGSTAVQVVNGMAGMIVVKGPIDEVPEIAAARDILLAVHDLGLFPSASSPDLWEYDPPQNAMWNPFTGESTIIDPSGGAGAPASSGFSASDYPLRLFLLNGQPFFEEEHNPEVGKTQFPIGKQLEAPRFTVRPGEVVRFRMLNACSDNLLPVVVDEHTMYLLAIDGVNFLETKAVPYVEGAQFGQEQVLLPPAGRAEFLIQASAEPGVYAIRQLFHGTDVQFFASAEKVIAEIVVAGNAVAMGLPGELPTPSRYYPLTTGIDPAARRDVVFNINFDAATVKNKVVGGDFTVNGELYDETSVTFQPKLDTVEEWTLSVEHDAGAAPEGHPFHLHENSFEVVEIGGKAVSPVELRDTVWIPPMEKVVIRVRFKEFPGKTVFHCHILPHEDAGMMQNILVVT
ncbi:multicopper oxidase family protein [Sorangium sp. So ce388]|uniref:multicopper oxidase family protein n=1 Tax=Sorangium sp. So ce388 TaxID=3133309 RepID=UPI003F5C571B